MTALISITRILTVAVAGILLPLTLTDSSNDSAGGTGVPLTPVTISTEAASPEAAVWADSVMQGLSLRQRVAQLVVPRLDVADNAAGREAVRRAVVTQGVGGLLFGKGTLADYAVLIRYAQSLADIPLLITLDGEWGLRMRVTDAPQFPVNMALGASPSDDAIEAYGAEVARECRAIGINVNFAPVADVNSNPSNPIIGSRSFGDDPLRVTRATLAYARGLESGGVLSVAKHFPGHGDTSTDSHKTLPIVAHDRATLESVDLYPFRKYADARLGGVMVGHLNVPALDASGTPASLSQAITTGLLRRNMQFDGLVFTDALAMAGATSGTNNCVAAIKAGTDILLQPRAVASDIDAVVKAVENGSISRATIDDRCRRVLAFKYALGLNRRPQLMPVAEAVATVRSQRAEDTAARLAQSALTIVHDRDRLLPVDSLSSRRIAVVSVGAPANNEFADMCARYAPVAKLSVDASRGVTDRLMAQLNDYDMVISAVFTDKPWARTALERLSTLRLTVGVMVMNPYQMARFGATTLNRLDALMITGDDTPQTRRAAAEGVFGGCAVDGRMPVSLPGIARSGQGVSTPKVRLGFGRASGVGFDDRLGSRIDSVMLAAVASGAVPGAQVVVVRDGTVAHMGNYGTVERGGRQAVTDSTIYDLASVTKPAATVAGLMRALDEGLFELDDRISDIVEPLQSTDKAGITYRDALYHTSGMPAMISAVKLLTERDTPRSKPHLRSDLVSRSRSDDFNLPLANGLWLADSAPDSLMQRIYDSNLKTPGKLLYSDLNFCLLREALERMTEVPLDEWVATEIYGPIGASTLGFCPLDYYPARHIAPTERDTDFRNQLVRGYVHDETAAASGGVQGNAGLFGNALDLAKLFQMWLDGGVYGGRQIVSEPTVGMFTSASARRHLTDAKGRQSWRMPGLACPADDSPMLAGSWGHTGFTGTCFWVDPDQRIVMVLLSNRINPSRKTPAFFKNDPRTGVVQAIYDSITD